MRELRVHLRRLLQSTASIIDAQGVLWHSVQLLDISRMGVAFSCTHEMQCGAVCQILFCLPGQTMRNEATLRIVHCAPSASGYRLGARIIELEQQCADRIVEFVVGEPTLRT